MTKTKTQLTSQMRNVLEAMVEQTTKTSGTNRGEVKSRIVKPGVLYDIRTLKALASRGLIECKINTVNGDGWAATQAGVSAVAKRLDDHVTTAESNLIDRILEV